MSEYHLEPEKVANLYNQEYLHKAELTPKFLSLDGQLQRAVIEEALIQVEAHKLSKTYGQEVQNQEAAYFSKYREFYAYQAAKDPEAFRKKDSRFLTLNWSKKGRDLSRTISISHKAYDIDNAPARSTLQKVRAMTTAGRG